MCFRSPIHPFVKSAQLGRANAGPGWFTSVMGTGILAICIALAPVALPLEHAVSLVLWITATLLFVAFTLALVASVLRSPNVLASTLRDPLKAQLWGAPPMAAFTVAVGFLRIGETVLPSAACIAIAQVLWIAGAIGSIASAFLVPYLMFTVHRSTAETTFGSWLLPVVPPIVASVPAALLLQTWPAAIREDMLALAYALLGIGIILAAILIVIFYSRLVYERVPAGPLVPTLWIVVGPLGQSIAGFIALGLASRSIWPALANGLLAAAIVYGVLVWGFAVYWLAMAIAVTLRAMRVSLPFSLGWWAFTFPVGVLTVGTDALFTQTHAGIFATASLALLVLLAAMWLLVAITTIRGVLGTLRSHLSITEIAPLESIA